MNWINILLCQYQQDAVTTWITESREWLAVTRMTDRVVYLAIHEEENRNYLRRTDAGKETIKTDVIADIDNLRCTECNFVPAELHYFQFFT